MADLIFYIPNHGYIESTTVTWLDANYFVRDPDTDSFKISTTDDDLSLVQFTETITDGFVREVDTSAGTTTITGLEHIEGELAKVVASGIVVFTHP